MVSLATPVIKPVNLRRSLLTRWYDGVELPWTMEQTLFSSEEVASGSV